MKKCALYARVSTPEQHVETQLYDLRQLPAQRGFEVVAEYTDQGVSGTKATPPRTRFADGRRPKAQVLRRARCRL